MTSRVVRHLSTPMVAVGDEIAIAIERGKTLVVRLHAVGETDPRFRGGRL